MEDLIARPLSLALPQTVQHPQMLRPVTSVAGGMTLGDELVLPLLLRAPCQHLLVCLGGGRKVALILGAPHACETPTSTGSPTRTQKKHAEPDVPAQHTLLPSTLGFPRQVFS